MSVNQKTMEYFTVPIKWVFFLVHHIDLWWNTLEPSLVLMHQKLIDIPGFTAMVDGEKNEVI